MILTLSIFLVLVLASSLVITAQGENNPDGQGNSGDGANLGSQGDGDSGEVNANTTNQGSGETIRNRVQTGVYTSPEGEQIRVSETAQNRIRIESGGVEAECECELEQEQVQNRTRLKTQLSNGRKAEIKVMPDTASETALNRLRLKVCSEENNCTIQLKEVGKGNQTQLAYEMQIQRHFRLLGMFRAKAQVKAQVNAENGELVRTKKPWWAFLATEPEE